MHAVGPAQVRSPPRRAARWLWWPHLPVAGDTRTAGGRARRYCCRRTRSGGRPLQGGVPAQHPFQRRRVAFWKAEMYSSSGWPRARWARRCLRQPGPVPAGRGPAADALTGRRAGAQHGGDLGGGEGQHLTQEEHRPLRAGQVLQAGDQRQSEVSRGRRRRRQGASAGWELKSTAGHRLKPADTRFGRYRGGSGGVWYGPPGRTAARVGCDARARSGRRWWRSGTARPVATSGPRTWRTNARLAGRSPGPGPGLVERAEQPVAVGQQFPPERLGAAGELLPACYGRRLSRHPRPPPRLVLPGADRRPRGKESPGPGSKCQEG